MKYKQTIYACTFIFFLISCSNGKLEEKGFQVSPISDNTEIEQSNDLVSDSLKIETRASGVLLTGHQNIRLTTIYKVNVNKKNNTTFIGGNSFHYRYEEYESIDGNRWNNNLMPGLEAVYGYNFVNISHYDIKENKQKEFFEKPVLIKTLYYPTFDKDTLNNEAVNRKYFLVSVYNDDTNKDGFINTDDLRRFYLFDINGVKQKALIPENYTVFQSEYDSANDFMFVYAQLDSNNNGEQDEREPVHIFWIDLKDPNRTGRQY
jgi:hypothetical protein